MHLAEKFPESCLLPPVGTAERTECYKWISFVLTELDSLLWTIAKHRFALPKERRVPTVVDCAVWEFEAAVKTLATGLGDRAYLVGTSFSVADIIAGHTLLWASSARLEVGAESLVRYLNALKTRDAFTRARDKAHVVPALPI
jgi:glutathione S-transferase